MRASWLLAVVVGLLCSSGPASAQVLSVEFHDGNVRLIAENVPVGRILTEWSRLGGTKIVNGERIPGAPVTLQLLDVPERQALDVVLRGAAGYIVAGREAAGTGASVFDRILILPTTSRAPSTAALPPPVAQPVAQPAPQFVEPEDQADGPESQPGLPGVVPPGALNRLPRGRVQLPGGPPVNPAQPQAETEPVRPPETPQTRPANPFAAQPGSTRPGVLAPTTPPRNPNEPTPQDR